jgi:hypothetical protein
MISISEIHISCVETTSHKLYSRTIFMYVSGMKLDKAICIWKTYLNSFPWGNKLRVEHSRHYQ